MDSLFLNSGNCKTSEPYRLLLNLTNKINLKKSDKYAALSNLSMYYTWRNKKSKTMKLKYQVQHEVKYFNNLMNHIL